ncbi:MAG: hypothetical protein K9M11_03740 [Candidatus Pacebacteria bacterium]|nr:hypothetical protein [Candidatus Paceibacterota bacterium]
MLYTLIGLFVTVTPFILVRLFKNKLNGFFTVLTSLFFVHLCTALITQSIHVFTYDIILSIHTIVLCIALLIYKRNRNSVENGSSLKDELKSNFNIGRLFIQRSWFILIIVFLGLAVLYSIRFNYSGTVDTAFGTKQVSHSSYTYPLYSDEWVGSSLVAYSIESKSLPLVNPLNANSPFINFLMASHAVFAEIILFFGLNSLTQYIYLAVLNSIFLCFSVFVISKLMNVRQSIAIVAALSVLLITNSGNLPGTWFVLPYIASLSLYLSAIVGFLLKNRLVLFGNLIASVLLYPPFIIFVVPFLLGISYDRKINFEKIHFFALRTIILFVVALGLVTLFALQSFTFSEIFSRATSFVFRQSLDNGRVSFDIWNIVPLYIIPFIPIGLYSLYKEKKKYILFPVVAGILFWIYYSLTTMVFLIEPSRIIVITSVLFLISSALGMERLYMYVLNHKALVFNPSTLISMKIILCIFFAFYVFNLPKLGLWHKLPLQAYINNMNYSFIPSPPVTRYLNEDDLRLFSGYTHKFFIAPPWKGLVIGVATENYPLDSKPSTLTNNILGYSVFLQASCDKKKEFIKKYNISLVYSSPVSCEGFLRKIGSSSEGLTLYRVEMSD